jgi:hypothetical protein
LISKLYKSPHAKSSQFGFTAHMLVQDLKNEGSPASVLMLLLSSEYPTTELSWQGWGPCYKVLGQTQQKTLPQSVFL